MSKSVQCFHKFEKSIVSVKRDQRARLIKRLLCRLLFTQDKMRGLLEYVYADLWEYVFIVKVWC